MTKMKTPPPCVNLRERFGRKYKVVYGESYNAEYGPNAKVEDPWLMIIPCQHGHICPWGDELLAACTNYAGRIANRLRKLPYVTVAQDGDDGINATFDAKHFAEIAEIMLPRKKRTLSESQRQQNIERLRRFWPAKRETVFDVATQQAGAAPECDAGTPGDSQAV